MILLYTPYKLPNLTIKSYNTAAIIGNDYSEFLNPCLGPKFGSLI